MSLPLLVRPNSVIPIGSHTDKPNYDYSDGVTLQVYRLEDEKQTRVEIPSLDGKIETTFDISREEKMLRIQRQGPSKPWNVLLVRADAVENIENVETKIVNGSTLIQLNGDVDHWRIQLR
jgi:alpha-D-xyloside xylohydrolase